MVETLEPQNGCDLPGTVDESHRNFEGQDSLDLHGGESRQKKYLNSHVLSAVETRQEECDTVLPKEDLSDPPARQVLSELNETVPALSSQTRKLATWKRNRAHLDKRLRRCRVFAAVFGLAGAGFAVAQHEMVLRSVDPRSAAIDFFKTCNLVCTLAVLVFLYQNYFYLELSSRLSMHISAFFPLDTRVYPMIVLLNRYFWFEIMICSVHCLPFVTFELVTENWLNIIMYRAETLGAVINTLRIYLLFPVIRDIILNDLPLRHTISSLTDTETGAVFAFKVALNDKTLSMVFIACFWGISCILTGFWFRAAEFSACLLPTAKSPACSNGMQSFGVSSLIGYLPNLKSITIYIYGTGCGACS